ncbi:DUF6088 family protein [Sessilibacter corallicola]|uniref:Transcriptional regulator, AbiEi antitoxin, Type IV TA system n=1 Tax=Sessilibacter corallicola TaxID=2904075 RepID=A0ABQ0ABT0_9GAMM
MSKHPIRDKILNKIQEFEYGQPITYRELKSCGFDSAVQRSIKHFCQTGILTRVMTGFYVRPKRHASLPNIMVTCGPEKLAKVWAKERGYILTSTDFEEMYQLRFQTQMPIRPRFWTDGPNKTFKVGNASVSVEHVSSEKLKWHDIPLGRFYRAIQARDPEWVKPKELLEALKLLGQSDEEIGVSIATLTKEPSLSSWIPLLEAVRKSLP